MRRLLTALAIFAAASLGPASAQDQGKEEEDPVLEEPEPEIPEEMIYEDDIGWGDGPQGGRLVRGERDGPAVFARMREGGVLELKSGDEWKASTLEECGTFLATARDKGSLEELQDGIKATKICLSVDVEPTVPWHHVQWLMTVAAEQKYRRLELRDGSRHVLVFLPLDVAICCCSGDPPPEPPEVKASVELLVRKDECAKRGDAEVMVPTDVCCKYGSKETTDLEKVVAHLKTVRQTAEEYQQDRPETVFFGEIKADPRVPFRKVFDVMEAFVSAEITDVELWGTAIPPKAVREAMRLPYPVKNCETAD